MLLIAGIAVIVGTAGVLTGIVLLDLIRLSTNLAYFGRLSLVDLKLGHSPLGLAVVGCRWSAA